jgi:ATP-binding cassette, subfamily F, member 3
LVELKHITKHFKDIDILDNAFAEIERGDKIALIGANGKGKSTLLRIIAGTEPFQGERKWGHNIDPAFYAQHQLEALNLSHTIIDEMKQAGSQKTELELRSLLGCFLFSGDDADKKIKVLSGGEKARVALAKTILSKANFLLLDEPTNHLDIHSTELLVDALNRYGGSYILVSHDRYFISKTANKIWEIVDHEIKEFKGGYEEYVEWKERMSARKPEGGDQKPQAGSQKSEASTRKAEVKVIEKPTASPSATPAKTISEPDKSALKKELQKQQKAFQQLEKKIAELAQKKEELELMLTKPEIYADKDAFKKTESGYKEALAKLETANKEYEKVFEKIIELDEQLLA